MTKAHFFRTDSMCVFVETNKECSIFRGSGTQKRNSCMCYCRNSECIFRLIKEILPQRSKCKMIGPSMKNDFEGPPPFLFLVSLVSLYYVFNCDIDLLDNYITRGRINCNTLSKYITYWLFQQI